MTEMKQEKLTKKHLLGYTLGDFGVEEKTEENYNKGIEVLETDLEPGTDANLYLGTDI